MIPEEEYGLLSQQHDEVSDNEQEEAIEFISYAESDDDDEDPYFMPEHNKRTSTWTFLRYFFFKKTFWINAFANGGFHS
jgi:hypothetical protein